MPRLALLALLLAPGLVPAADPPRLKVSDNRRFLVTADGKPFFYLGDTAWELFHRLTREDADRYLRDRAAKGFTVIQAVALAEFDGLRVPNAYGHLPLTDNDPLKPNDDYFRHVDWVVDRAAELGLTVGMLPTWGDKWHRKSGAGPEVFTPENAAAYGEWVGKRYKNKPIIWILGGDRDILSDKHRDIHRAMARGLRAGDGGTHLITFHPSGGQGSAQQFPTDSPLDVHMLQSGHGIEYTGRYDRLRAEYARTPAKPALDGEPIYEGHPLAFKAKSFGHSVAADVRRPFYWDVFGGACGHTYGHHSIWQFYAPGREPINDPLLPWTDALSDPGAAQMGIGRRLMESRPQLSRVPADDVLVPDRVSTLVPGAGSRRFAACRDAAGSYAMVYAPVGRPFDVRLDQVNGPTVRASWFDPRTGAATPIGEFAATGSRRFVSPTPGELLDWVLVLDEAGKNYPPPGQTR